MTKVQPVAQNDVDKHLEMALAYAWNSHSYHVGHRLAAFNFFVIFIGIAVVGYMKCIEMAGNADQIEIESVWWGLSVGVAIFGILVSIAFWFLEIRNEELVICGRKALDTLEQLLRIEGQNGPIHLKIRNDDQNRIYLEDSLDIISRRLPLSWLKFLTRHRFWWRLIMLGSAIAFVIATVFSIFEYYSLISEGPKNILIFIKL